MDQQLTAVDPVGAQTNREYDLADRLEKTTLPRGVGGSDPTDFVTQNIYDALDRVITEVRYPCQPRADCTNQGESPRRTHSCYQTGSGDLLWVIAPNAQLPSPPAPPNTCNDLNPQLPSHTTRYSYDDGHRQLTETTQEGAAMPLRTRTQSHDANGNVTSEIDEDGARTDSEYSQRDELLKTIETFQKDINDIPTRILTTAYVYDLAGNLMRQVSPRAWDACTAQPGGCDPGVNGDYVTEYLYDEADRQTRVDLPKKGIVDPRTYVHNAYDKNGNLTMTSLPVVNQNVADVPLDKQTTFTYWDPGWIQSSWDHVDNPVSFDYTAEGWQTSRVSDRRNGSVLTWEYWPDGMLHRAVDRGGQDAVYTYDLDKNMIEASENRGQGQSPRAYKVQGEYNGFDEPSKTRQVAEGANWTFTARRYDANGNVSRREDDGLEQTDHTLIQHGRLNLFTYNWVDEETRQDELGTDWQDPDPLPSTGDLRVDRTYFETGWPKTQIVHRYSGSWLPRANTSWSYFANGDLETLTTKDYQDPVKTLEQHTLGYEQSVSGRMVYVNGNRTTDSFMLRGPPPPAQPTACESTCTTRYKYGVRENLTGETRIHGPNTTATCYALDPAMNVTDEWELNQACPDEGSPTGNPRRHFEYPLGTRLTKMQDNGAGIIRKYFHDDDGNLTCVTRTDASSGSDCPDPVGATVSANLEERLGWHYQSRLQTYHRYGLGAGTATYFHDPFDRLVRETETHEGQPDRETTFTYQGLSNLETRETSGPQTKSYVYDDKGQLVTMTQNTGIPPAAEFGYSMNVHGDPSLLLNLVSDEVHATYGYKGYGSNDAGLSRVDTDPLYPTNPYRFNAKRYDPGSTTLAMGARRYNTDIGRFVQQDFLIDSSEDVTLVLDAPTQNRYVFGAGNPVELMETDGHTFTRRRDPWPRLWTKKMKWNARFIYSVARRSFLPSGRVLPPGRARELVGASNAESTLGRRPVNVESGAIGLFHLIGPYQTRGKSMLDGDLMRPWINTCAIMPNFVAFWDIYPNAALALGATTVESSESNLTYYRGKLREIPPARFLESQRFGPPPKPGVTRCMYRGRTVPAKPICAPYFGGTKYAGPPNRCSEDGTDLQPWSRN